MKWHKPIPFNASVLFSSTYSVIKNDENAKLVKRRIGDDNVKNAITILMLYLSLFIISSIYSYKYKIGEMYFIPIGFITCFIVPILFKIIHLKMIIEFHIINLLFVAFSIVFGSILNFYSWIYYDKILHFTSGILFCSFAYILYSYFITKNHSKVIPILCLIFINAFNMMIAVFWEF